MRRDWITWGVIAFALGALLTWAVPDMLGDERAARDDGTVDTTTEGAQWTDWVGNILMLLGLGLALAGVFKDGLPTMTHRR